MIYQIKNDKLTVEVNSLGAELWSIKDNMGKEYLWQGDENSWAKRATNLFPFCGRMTNGVYTYQGKEYEMIIHGFAKLTEFTLAEQEDQVLVLSMEDNEKTYPVYPFHFRFSIRYELEKSKLKISYIVENKDDRTMYFAVGGHPGFQIPIDKKMSFEDYEIVFEKPSVTQILLSDDYFMTEKQIECSEVIEGKMGLRHNLFDRDAIILTDMGNSITIQAEKTDTKIRVSFPDMTYLALWHTPMKKVPFVCIEPWSSIPARQDIVEDLEEKSDLNAVKAGKVYRNNWEIEIIK